MVKTIIKFNFDKHNENFIRSTMYLNFKKPQKIIKQNSSEIEFEIRKKDIKSGKLDDLLEKFYAKKEKTHILTHYKYRKNNNFGFYLMCFSCFLFSIVSNNATKENVDLIYKNNEKHEFTVTNGYEYRLFSNYTGRNIGNEIGLLHITSLDKNIEEISRFEKIITSYDLKKYETYINVDNFVDFFILSELFLSESEVVFYKDIKINVAMLEYKPSEVGNEVFLLIDNFWYKYLLKDTSFTDKIIDRYDEMRRSELTNNQIESILSGNQELLDKVLEKAGFLDKNIDKLRALSHYSINKTDIYEEMGK